MPAIPVDSAEWEELAFKTARLCLQPQSLDATAALERNLRGQWIGAVFKMLGFANMTLTDEEALLMLQSKPDMSIGEEKDIRGWLLSGLILTKALRLAFHIGDQAGVKKAITLVIRDLEMARQPLKEATLWAVWKKFQPVCHFAGAWTFTAPHFLPAIQALATETPTEESEALPKEKFTPEQRAELLAAFEREAKPLTDLVDAVIPKFFAVAEDLRKLGQQHYSHGQKVQNRPLLDPEVMWTVPASFSLPIVKINLGAPLSDDEMRALEKATSPMSG